MDLARPTIASSGATIMVASRTNEAHRCAITFCAGATRWSGRTSPSGNELSAVVCGAIGTSARAIAVVFRARKVRWCATSIAGRAIAFGGATIVFGRLTIAFGKPTIGFGEGTIAASDGTIATCRASIGAKARASVHS